MNAKQCDRCKTLYEIDDNREENQENRRVKLEILKYYYPDNYIVPTKMDLCKKCEKELLDWFDLGRIYSDVKFELVMKRKDNSDT